MRELHSRASGLCRPLDSAALGRCSGRRAAAEERAVRGHDEAGENLAMLLSMTATCLLHGVNPEVWLADVLIAVGEPGFTADDLLPGHWKTTRGPTVKPLYDLNPP